MDDLVEFLRARLDEDWARADGWNRAWKMAVLAPSRGGWPYPDGKQALAEVEAKRRIIEVHVSGDALCDRCAGSVDECPTLQLLSLPYADHPDWQQEWAPSV